jgi:hypothetical protein
MSEAPAEEEAVRQPTRGALGPERSFLMMVAMTCAITHIARVQNKGGSTFMAVHAALSMALAIALVIGPDAQMAAAIGLSTIAVVALTLLPSTSKQSAPLIAAAGLLAIVALFSETPSYAPIYDTFSTAGDSVNAGASLVMAFALVIAVASAVRKKDINLLALAGWSAAVVGVFSARAITNDHSTDRRFEFAGAIQAIAELVIIPLAIAMPMGMDFQYITPFIAMAISAARAAQVRYGVDGKLDGLMIWRSVLRIGWADTKPMSQAEGVQVTCRAEAEAAGFTIEAYQACLKRNGLDPDGEVTDKTRDQFREDRVKFCKASTDTPAKLQRCLQSADSDGCLSACIGDQVAEPGNLEVCINHNQNLAIVSDKARSIRKCPTSAARGQRRGSRRLARAGGRSARPKRRTRTSPSPSARSNSPTTTC